ncbi:MAG TPA: hypothetical protein VHN78_16790, partial [Chloroflexota bacterium]|nr:hypothetical protein [Chloroflexota bacterium]
MDSTAFAGKRVTIMGLGFFGGAIGLARYLVAQGAQVTITDLKSAAELQDSVAALAGLANTTSASVKSAHSCRPRTKRTGSPARAATESCNSAADLRSVIVTCAPCATRYLA